MTLPVALPSPHSVTMSLLLWLRNGKLCRKGLLNSLLKRMDSPQSRVVIYACQVRAAWSPLQRARQRPTTTHPLTGSHPAGHRVVRRGELRGTGVHDAGRAVPLLREAAGREAGSRGRDLQDGRPPRLNSDPRDP